MATAHAWNYGVHAEENESGKTDIAGLVVRNFSEVASRIGEVERVFGHGQEWDVSSGSLDIDTRGLIQHIRDAVP